MKIYIKQKRMLRLFLVYLQINENVCHKDQANRNVYLSQNDSARKQPFPIVTQLESEKKTNHISLIFVLTLYIYICKDLNSKLC